MNDERFEKMTAAIEARFTELAQAVEPGLKQSQVLLIHGNFLAMQAASAVLDMEEE